MDLNLTNYDFRQMVMDYNMFVRGVASLDGIGFAHQPEKWIENFGGSGAKLHRNIDGVVTYIYPDGIGRVRMPPYALFNDAQKISFVSMLSYPGFSEAFEIYRIPVPVSAPVQLEVDMSIETWRKWRHPNPISNLLNYNVPELIKDYNSWTRGVSSLDGLDFARQPEEWLLDWGGSGAKIHRAPNGEIHYYYPGEDQWVDLPMGVNTARAQSLFLGLMNAYPGFMEAYRLYIGGPPASTSPPQFLPGEDYPNPLPDIQHQHDLLIGPEPTNKMLPLVLSIAAAFFLR